MLNLMSIPDPPGTTPEGRQGEGIVKPLQSLNNGVFNVRGCSTNVERKGEVSKMFLWRKLDVCVLSEIKFKGKCEVMSGRGSGVGGGRAKEGWRCY